jgi:hypothetical protein
MEAPTFTTYVAHSRDIRSPLSLEGTLEFDGGFETQLLAGHVDDLLNALTGQVRHNQGVDGGRANSGSGRKIPRTIAAILFAGGTWWMIQQAIIAGVL